MSVLKEVKHYPETNSVEATWVDRAVTPAVGVEGEEGYQPERIDEKQVRCHSYADVQMDMLRADLGADAADYEELMVTVEANIKPPAPRPGQRAAEIKAELSAIDLKSIRALREGDTARITALEAQAQVLRDELRLL